MEEFKIEEEANPFIFTCLSPEDNLKIIVNTLLYNKENHVEILVTTLNTQFKVHFWGWKSPFLPIVATSCFRGNVLCLKGVRSYFKGVVLAPSHVSRRLFECDKRLEWVNHSPVGDKWVMTDPHEPLKFKINNSLSRIRHRKPATRGAWCSLNSLELGPESLYKVAWHDKSESKSSQTGSNDT